MNTDAMIADIQKAGYDEEQAAQIKRHWTGMYPDLCEGEHVFYLKGPAGMLELRVLKGTRKEESE